MILIIKVAFHHQLNVLNMVASNVVNADIMCHHISKVISLKNMQILWFLLNKVVNIENAYILRQRGDFVLFES